MQLRQGKMKQIYVTHLHQRFSLFACNQECTRNPHSLLQQSQEVSVESHILVLVLKGMKVHA